VFIIKRMYRPEWGDDWRNQLSTDFVNGHPGHELKLGERKLVGSYLRIGFAETALGACSNYVRISSPPTRCRWRTTSAPRLSFPLHPCQFIAEK